MAKEFVSRVHFSGYGRFVACATRLYLRSFKHAASLYTKKPSALACRSWGGLAADVDVVVVIVVGVGVAHEWRSLLHSLYFPSFGRGGCFVGGMGGMANMFCVCVCATFAVRFAVRAVDGGWWLM